MLTHKKNSPKHNYFVERIFFIVCRLRSTPFSSFLFEESTGRDIVSRLPLLDFEFILLLTVKLAKLVTHTMLRLSILGCGFLAMAYAQCEQGEISVVGAMATSRLSKAWAESFQESCPSLVIVTEDGGSSAGLARACATSQGSAAAEVAATTRLPLTAEASTTDGWNFKCERSPRSLILVRSSNLPQRVALGGVGVS